MPRYGTGRGHPPRSTHARRKDAGPSCVAPGAANPGGVPALCDTQASRNLALAFPSNWATDSAAAAQAGRPRSTSNTGTRRVGSSVRYSRRSWPVWAPSPFYLLQPSAEPRTGFADAGIPKESHRV